MTQQLPEPKIQLDCKATLRAHDEQPPVKKQHMLGRPSPLPARPVLSVRLAIIPHQAKTLCIRQRGDSFEALAPHVPQLCERHLHVEGLPAQACDPLAVASEGPAHLLPCAWVPQENLRDRSLLNNPLHPVPGSTKGPRPLPPIHLSLKTPEPHCLDDDHHLPGRSCSPRPTSCRLGTRIC